MKVAPDEVDRVGHSVLLSHSTQHLLFLATTLVQGTEHSDQSNKTTAANQSAFAGSITESTQCLSAICDVLHCGGLSFADDVRTFVRDGLGLDNNSTSRADIAAPTEDVTITLCSAAQADVMTLRNLLGRYDVYLSTVRDLYMIVACILDLIGRFLATKSAAAEASVARVADTVQDIENDASPVKARISTATDYFIVPVSTLLDKLLSLEAVLVDLIELHPVPYLIAVEDWAKSMCIVNTLHPALQTIQHSVQRYTSSIKEYGVIPTACLQSIEYENALSMYFNTILQAVSAHVNNAVQAQVDFYAQSAIECILRQEWTSHSKYMRDKKLTHGIVSMCTTMRQSIFEIYQQHASYVRNSVGYCAHLSAQSNNLSAFSLQMLLSMAVLVSRTYLGHHVPTEEIAQSNADNNSNPAATTTNKNLHSLLDISRVRTAQWQKDQHYFVYMILETVVWVLTQEILIRNSAAVDGNMANASSTKQIVRSTQIQQLLQLEQYTVHGIVLSELVLVVKYLLLGLYVSSGNAGEVVRAISTALSNVHSITRDGKTTGENSQASSGAQVWKDFMELLQDLSTGDSLLDCIHSGVSTSTGTTSMEGLSSGPTLAPLDKAFQLFDDMHTHSGLYSFHIHSDNVEEVALFKKELQASTANTVTVTVTPIAAAQRAVVLQRIATMHSKDVNLLIAVLTTDLDRFCDLHNAIHSSASDPTAREPADCVREFARFALLRRYEINAATYPPLTEGEAKSAVLIKAFLDTSI